MGLAYSYTYRATETEPTEHRIEEKEVGLKRPQDKYFRFKEENPSLLEED